MLLKLIVQNSLFLLLYFDKENYYLFIFSYHYSLVIKSDALFI